MEDIKDVLHFDPGDDGDLMHNLDFSDIADPMMMDNIDESLMSDDLSSFITPDMKLESCLEDYFSQSSMNSPQSPQSVPSSYYSQESMSPPTNPSHYNASPPQPIYLQQLLQPQNQVYHKPEPSARVGDLTIDQLRELLAKPVSMPAQPLKAPAVSLPATHALLPQPTTINIRSNIQTIPSQNGNAVNTPVSIITSSTLQRKSVAKPKLQNTRPAVTPKVIPSTPQVAIVSSSPPSQSDKMPIMKLPNHHKPKERKSSHNVIEKRYRMSINDKIIELKNLVMSPETKLNKSAVLKKAIGTIQNLRNMKLRLSAQNEILKGHIRSKYGEDPETIIRANMQDITSITTMSEAYPDSPYTPDSSPSASPSSPSTDGEDGPQLKSQHNPGMVDGLRTVLCVFMFAVLAFNPFSSFFAESSGGSLSDGSVKTSSRTLQSWTDPISDSLGLWNWILPNVALWMLNTLLTLYILTKILVDGEPVTGSSTEESTRYWRHMKQADCDLNNDQYSSAENRLKESLQVLGRPFPTTRLELWSGLSWQFFRQLLHRTYIAFLFCKRASKLNVDRVKSSKHAATAYHKLLQLSCSGKVEVSAWQQLYLVLCSVNLAEAASSAIGRDVLAHIYATAAVTALKLVPHQFHFVSRFLLGRCRKQCVRYGREEAPINLRWLCEPAGHRYLVDLTWYQEMQDEPEPLFTTNKHPYDPLASLMQSYRQHLLRKASLSFLHSSSALTQNTTALSCIEAIDLTNPLEVETDSPYPVSSHVDSLAHWWSAVIAVGVYLSNGDPVHAERYYQTLSALPSCLTNADDDSRTLPLAIISACKAMKSIQGRSLCLNTALRECEKASQLLRDFHAGKQDRSPIQLNQGFQLLALDWLLSVRTELWRHELPTANFSHELVVGFKLDLNNYSKILKPLNAQLALPEKKSTVHSVMLRTMLGANPSKSNQILRTSCQENARTPSLHLRSDNKRQLLAQAALQDLGSPFNKPEATICASNVNKTA